jgi:MMPL family protein
MLKGTGLSWETQEEGRAESPRGPAAGVRSTGQMGVGLAAAVLIDATIIRVLLPAIMALLGERNWYFPKWLRWLPDLTHDEPAVGPAPGVREHDGDGRQAPVRV